MPLRGWNGRQVVAATVPFGGGGVGAGRRSGSLDGLGIAFFGVADGLGIIFATGRHTHVDDEPHHTAVDDELAAGGGAGGADFDVV